MDMEECYKRMQEAWIGTYDVKPGDTVKVLRKVKPYETGWNNASIKAMDECVGKTFIIGAISNIGIYLEGSCYYPWFVLELVSHKPAVLSLPTKIQEIIEGSGFDGICNSRKALKEFAGAILDEARNMKGGNLG